MYVYVFRAEIVRFLWRRSWRGTVSAFSDVCSKISQCKKYISIYCVDHGSGDEEDMPKRVLISKEHCAASLEDFGSLA